MRAVHSRVSFAELERWPEDGRRYQLYDGEVYEVPSPILLHQIVAGRLTLTLNDHVREHGGIVVVCSARHRADGLRRRPAGPAPLYEGTRRPAGFAEGESGAADLAIEILSPSTAANDRGRKMQLLARHRVREFWLVDPETATIEVYALNGQQFAVAEHGVRPRAGALAAAAGPRALAGRSRSSLTFVRLRSNVHCRTRLATAQLATSVRVPSRGVAPRVPRLSGMASGRSGDDAFIWSPLRPRRPGSTPRAGSSSTPLPPRKS